MKFAKILSVLAAAAALFVGCVQEMPGDLAELQVSSSFVSIPANGGSATITVKSSAAWSVAELDAKTAAWLTVSPMSGSAGETTVTFSAPETNTTKSAELKINVGEKTQFINVKQPVASTEVTNSSCAEVLAGADGKTYRIKGVVSAIEANVYGNYNVTDDTGTVYVYGTLDANGAEKNFASWGIENGDIVTVEGPKSTYNGKVELVNVTVIAIEKSLIKVEEAPEEPIALEGGDFDVVLTCKGDGVSVIVPEAAKSWLSVTAIVTSGTKATVTFTAAPNAAGDRSTGLTFTTTSGGKTYTAETSVSQKGAIIECSILDFNSAEVGDTQYRLTGMVTEIAKADYGNIYISDWSDKTYVYGIGSKGDFAKLGVEVGDIITLVGKRAAYNGSPQMSGGQYESHIDVTEVDFPTFNAAEASKDVYYRLTGTITEIKKADYGNLYIQDEAGNKVYVYGVYSGWGASGDARKGALARYGIEVGDILTVEGYKDVYDGTIELCGGIYVSHEKGKGGDDSTDPGTDPVGPTVTFTVDNLPTAYAVESVITYGAFDFFVNQVANYGNGIQMKKAESYIANKTAFKKIKKVTLVGSKSKTWYPGNLQMFGGSAEKPETEIKAADENCLVYDFSASNCTYFKLANTSNYAVYLESITVEYEQ